MAEVDGYWGSGYFAGGFWGEGYWSVYVPVAAPTPSGAAGSAKKRVVQPRRQSQFWSIVKQYLEMKT